VVYILYCFGAEQAFLLKNNNIEMVDNGTSKGQPKNGKIFFCLIQTQ
jgi:hypothetical protein